MWYCNIVFGSFFVSLPSPYIVTARCGPGPPLRGLTITLRHTTFGRIPLDMWSVSAQTCTWQHSKFIRDRRPVPPVGFEPAIPASERPQTHATNRSATVLGLFILLTIHNHPYSDFRWLSSSSSGAEPPLIGGFGLLNDILPLCSILDTG